MLNGLDLFSGIGGMAIALAPWVKPAAYCEIDRYAQGVLLSRMSEGQLQCAPIWEDVQTLRGDTLPKIDIIAGGFPCQDVSTSGARAGLDGERTGLFREAIRLIRECKPQFVFFENVGGIRRFSHIVRGELEVLGYDCRDGYFAAVQVGACHIRNRWWLLAYARSQRLEKMESTTSGRFRTSSYGTLVLSEIRKEDVDSHSREDDGISIPVGGIKGLGNAVVPLQAREAFKILMGIKEQN